MKEKSFVIVPLEESEAKRLAQVIANDTSRKILAILSEADASETEIANSLHLPISTTHYNMQALVRAGLVEIRGFRWSEKGNKIFKYGLAKKYVVIAPKGISVIKREIKNLLPVFALAVVGTFLIKFYMQRQTELLAITSPAKEAEALPAAASAAAAVAQPNYALWFFIGATFAIVAYLVIILISSRLKGGER